MIWRKPNLNTSKFGVVPFIYSVSLVCIRSGLDQSKILKIIFRSVLFFLKKMVFEKLFFKFYCISLLLEKLVNRKYFPVNEKYFSVKEKFDLVFRKIFFFYFERKTLSGNYEKFRNVILFADYIKFGSQTFDCYIYFVLNICFSISFLII